MAKSKLHTFLADVDTFNAGTVTVGADIKAAQDQREALLQLGMKGLGLKRAEVEEMLSKVYGRVVAAGDDDATALTLNGAAGEVVMLDGVEDAAKGETGGDVSTFASEQTGQGVLGSIGDANIAPLPEGDPAGSEAQAPDPLPAELYPNARTPEPEFPEAA